MPVAIARRRSISSGGSWTSYGAGNIAIRIASQSRLSSLVRSSQRCSSSGVRFKERALPAKDAAEYVSQSLQSYTARYEARVTVHAPASELAGRRWLGDVTALDEHRSEVRTSDDNLDWLAMRIAMLTAPYEVHEPPELIERLRAIATGIEGAIATP